jgi:hypothetical protein
MGSTYEDFKKENRLKLFGHEDADKENEDRLLSYYYRTNQYEDVVSDIALQIVTGEKGTGKSALLKIAYIESKSSSMVPIWIRLDDLSELYSTILEDSNLYAMKTLWKKSISKLIVMKLAASVNLTMNEDYEKALAWAYDTGYTSRNFISRISEIFKPLYEKYIALGADATSGSERGVLERIMRKRSVRIFLDDFDLDWKGNTSDVLKLKSLLLSLSDMCCDIEGLSVRIALRTDVYEMIRDEEFSDKFESSLIRCRWNNNEIIKALCKRICAYFDIKFDDSEATLQGMQPFDYNRYLNYVFEPRFGANTRCWRNAPVYRVIFSLIRRKPRDMVKLCHGVAEQAYLSKLNKINDQCFLEILENYSQERLKDLVNEYKNQVSLLRSLLIRMAPTKEEIRSKSSERYVYTTSQLHNKIKNILTNIPVKIYQPESEQMVSVDFHDVSHFLYKIGFITGRKRKPSGKLSRVYYDESPYLLLSNIGDGGFAWEIHPAYRGALAKGINDSWELTLDVEDEDLE